VGDAGNGSLGLRGVDVSDDVVYGAMVVVDERVMDGAMVVNKDV